VAGSKTDLILGNTQAEGWGKKKKCQNTQFPGQYLNLNKH
jgi:hypothetical protein